MAEDKARDLRWQTNMKSNMIQQSAPFSMTLNDSLIHISRSRQYLTLNISVTVQD